MRHNGTTGYGWDYENRLTSVTLPGAGGVVTFSYDPFGRRIQKSSASGWVNYVYDGANLLAEVDALGNAVAAYAQGAGIDEPLAMWRAGVTSYYQADGLGSITSLANAAGALSATYTYDAFGNLTNSAGDIVNPLRYTGREWDQETGLYYNRAQYYDPHIGRFTSEDSRFISDYAGQMPAPYRNILNEGRRDDASCVICRRTQLENFILS